MDPTSEEYEEASLRLSEFNEIIRPYSIGLFPQEADGKRVGIGSGVLISNSKKYAILTAGHVAKAIESATRLGLCFGARLDECQKYFLQTEFLKFEILGKKPIQGPDIALIFLPESVVASIKAKALFYSIEQEKTLSEMIIDTYPFVCMGALGSGVQRHTDHELIPLMGMGVVGSSYKERAGFDYINCRVSINPIGVRLGKEKAILNYQGISGSPLWLFEKDRPFLVGIAHGQDMTEVSAGGLEGTVFFHGPLSIYNKIRSFF